MVEQDGREVVVTSLEAGDVFGEMAVIDSKPRLATAVAKQKTTCVVMTATEFTQRLGRSDAFVGAIMRNMTQRLRKMNAIYRLLKKLDVG